MSYLIIIFFVTDCILYILLGVYTNGFQLKYKKRYRLFLGSSFVLWVLYFIEKRKVKKCIVL